MRRAVCCGAALCLLLAGCAAGTPAPSATPAPAESLSPVYTDTSRLTPYAPPEREYERWYDGPTDELRPRDDYGPLIPFQGGVLMEAESQYTAENLYGLATTSGKVVVDPVYTDVYRPWMPAPEEAEPSVKAPILVLSHGTLDESGSKRYAIAALAGSWCTGEVYGFDVDLLWDQNRDQGGVFLMRGDTLVFLSWQGEETFAADLAPLSLAPEYAYTILTNVQWLGEDVMFGCYNGDTDSYNYYRAARDGMLEQISIPEDVSSVDKGQDGLYRATQKDTWKVGYLGEDFQWAILPRYEGYDGDDFSNGYAAECDTEGHYFFIDRTGTPVDWEYYGVAWVDNIPWGAGRCWRVMGNESELLDLRDENLKAIDSPLVGQKVNVYNSWLTFVQGDELILCRGGETLRYPAEYGELVDDKGGVLSFFRQNSDESRTYTTVDRNGGGGPGTLTVIDENGSVSLMEDEDDGTVYLDTYLTGRRTLCDLTGKEVCSADGNWVNMTVTDGVVYIQQDGVSTLQKQDGTVLMRCVYDTGVE